ncbi:hypothetical protein RGQ30_29390 [Limnobacter thiooxidans]|uniref:Uncharacterized protein n=1 Tax=Limnobacter thiooxidans TaxID=131080 RepID=A0AA86J1R8_9BURK|nr:hypothetical protein RGQ30_29390 [Limnobacter thiooxidans]
MVLGWIQPALDSKRGQVSIPEYDHVWKKVPHKVPHQGQLQIGEET